MSLSSIIKRSWLLEAIGDRFQEPSGSPFGSLDDLADYTWKTAISDYGTDIDKEEIEILLFVLEEIPDVSNSEKFRCIGSDLI